MNILLYLIEKKRFIKLFKIIKKFLFFINLFFIKKKNHKPKKKNYKPKQ